MLKDTLEPLLDQLGDDFHANYRAARRFFELNDIVPSSLHDLEFLIWLPDKQRKFVSHPLSLNYFIRLLEKYPQPTPSAAEYVRRVIAYSHELRFHHAGLFIPPEHEMRLHELSDAVMRAAVDDKPFAAELSSYFEEWEHAEKSNEFYNTVYESSKERKPSTDIWHGIFPPITSVNDLLASASVFSTNYTPYPSDLSVLILDDENPKYWADRFRKAGIVGNIGVHYSPADAEADLRKNNYRLIVTDYVLGDGQPNGIEFAEKAFAIQKSKGIKPVIVLQSSMENINELAKEKKHLFFRVTKKGSVGIYMLLLLAQREIYTP
jgi:hypothetical protein